MEPSTVLKEKYLQLLLKEDYPNTPEITQELDKLYGAVQVLRGKKSDNEDQIRQIPTHLPEAG